MTFRLDGAAVLDALAEHVAIVEATNRSWDAFRKANGRQSGLSYIGQNYFGVCKAAIFAGAEGVSQIVDGIWRALVERRSSRHEYPCDSPTERRWFEVVARPYGDARYPMAMVIHWNITPAKVAVEIEHDFAIIAHTSAIVSGPTLMR